MIIGECPYCSEVNMTPIGPTPSFSLEECETCHKKYWLKHSRIESTAYPEDWFIVDEETKSLKLAEGKKI